MTIQFKAVSPWTEEITQKLLALWPTGKSARLIAAELGENFTRNAVLGKADRLGLPVRSGWRIEAAVPPARKAKAPRRIAPTTPRPSTPAPEPRRDIHGQLITTESLGFTDCKWPIGDPSEPDFHYCANPKDQTSVYCPHHHARAIQKVAA